MLEVKLGLLSLDRVKLGLDSGRIVALKDTNGGSTLIGNECLVKVNASVGASTLEDIEDELSKIRHLNELGSYKPDLTMDLSIVDDYTLLDELSNELLVPIGTLPHYRIFDRCSPTELKKRIIGIAELQARKGVSFFTIHPTATLELARIAANDRRTPITSRGGGILLRSMLDNGQTNPYRELLAEFVALCKSYDIAISVGSCFRPASNVDAFDRVHLLEIQMQFEYIQEIREMGGKVFFECLGHADLAQIDRYAEHISSVGAPMMALGPMTSDLAAGFDHVTNAIGSSALAMKGACHVINSVTREEHTGLVPSLDSVIEGVRSAHVAAHSVNIAKIPAYRIKTDEIASIDRAKKHSCVVDRGLFEELTREDVTEGCSRCGTQCPLLLTKKIQKYARR